MRYLLDVAFLPCEKLKDHDCRVVVDLLRASTQITTFFDAGGEMLLPVSDVEEARGLKALLWDDWKLMGERGGLPAPGFDLGNSPLELAAAGGIKNAVITTSNGTKAILAAACGSANVLIGCARNAEAVAWDALCCGSRIGVVAAGRDGEFSLEDSACAGLLVEKMLALAPSNGADEIELTDGAIAALAVWQRLGPDLEAISAESEHGRILRALGFRDDISFCCETDSTATVPKVSDFKGITAIVGR